MKNICTSALAAIAILAAGCSNSDTDYTVKPDMAGQEITFTAGINELATRAGRTTSNLTGSKFGLFLTTEGTNGDENYNATNKAVSENNGEWVQEPSLLWKSNTAKVSYTAYLPYTDQLENGNYTINLSTTQTAETMLNEDLLFASATDITAADNPGGITVKFSHKLAKLKVVLTKGTEVDADMEVTGVKVAKCLLKGSMDVTTGTLTFGSSAVLGDYADVNLCGTKTEGSAFTDTWEALIMPTVWGGNEFTVTVTVGSGNDRRMFQYQCSSWMACSGNEYTLSLQVGRDKIIAGELWASKWTDAGTSEIETDKYKP